MKDQALKSLKNKKETDRRTTGFSYHESEQPIFDWLHKAAENHKPKVSKSQLLIHILKNYRDTQKMLKDINQ